MAKIGDTKADAIYIFGSRIIACSSCGIVSLVVTSTVAWIGDTDGEGYKCSFGAGVQRSGWSTYNSKYEEADKYQDSGDAYGACDDYYEGNHDDWHW